MGGFKRFLLILVIIATMWFFLMGPSDLSDQAKLGIAALIVLEFIIFIFLPGSKTRRRPKKRKRAVKATATEDAEAEEETASRLPAPVTKDSLDGATLAERKRAKVKAARLEAEEQLESEVEGLVEVELEVEEEVHVAAEYVVDVNPQSIEDSDIEVAVEAKREHHARIRKRIEDRRRSQMADIRASTAQMWEDTDDREDLVSILSTSGHGLTILVEPEKVTPGKPWGSSFIRIDEARVLRMRLPLDDGFKMIGEKDEVVLPMVGGLPLPPPPLPGMDLPLPPPPGALPPPTGGQAALADLRSELDD